MVDTAGGHDPVELARIMIDAGARILQLRLKDVASRQFLAVARAIASMTRVRGATFIINHRVDITMLAEADGRYLGQEAPPLEAARRLLGPDRLIGISTHTIEQAREAEANGADY